MSDLCQFLLAVAEEHKIPCDKLLREVSDQYTREEQDNLDPGNDFIANTKDFNAFVRAYGFKEVNTDTVLLYLRCVKLVDSEQRNEDLSIDLEDETERQKQKIRYTQLVLLTSCFALFTFSCFL